MRYPLIYSLSTVGILKHYNQDYLIHEQRTDFTGANGVGKSIIADLFQLIFINDRDLFQFGTEGYKKEARQIQKLPHLCQEAYAFLSIEIDIGKFICIGVCIPNTTKRQLKPFIITADPDDQLPFSDRAFSHHQLPVAENFIGKTRQIVGIEDLGRHFRDHHGLYLEHYTGTKKDEHFARLYDQQLLPINLSIPSSRKSFAKIIQSFSRARSGGDKSEELKDFLFDGANTELEQTFDQHKSEIDRLLHDYEHLEQFITDLEAKQEHLELLNQLDAEHLVAKEKCMKAQCTFFFRSNERAKHESKQKESEYLVMWNEAEQLSKQLPQLERLASGYAQIDSDCGKKLDILKMVEEKILAIEKIATQIDELSLEGYPEIKEVPNDRYQIENYSERELIKRLLKFKPFYVKYGSIKTLVAQTESQKKQIEERRDQLNKKRMYYKKVVGLFSGTEEGTLIAKVLQSTEIISSAQEAVLFHFLDTSWEKPFEKDYPYYTDSFDFFQKDQIFEDQDKGGYWLKLDDFFISIPELKHEPVLADPQLRSKGISDLVKEQQQYISTIDAELFQISNFEKGETYDVLLAPLLANFDSGLYDFSVINEFSETAQLALQLGGMLSDLQKQKAGMESALSILFVANGMTLGIDVTYLKRQLQANSTCWSAKAVRYKSKLAVDRSKEQVIRETSLPALQQLYEQKKQLALESDKNYQHYQQLFEIEFPDQEIDFNEEISETEIKVLDDRFDTALKKYQRVYLACCEKFKETAGNNNLELTAETDAGRFNFSLLELVLLGSKIKFRDQIAEHLTTSNRSRHKLVQSIHETMLKIFIKTKNKYDEYRAQIRDLNLFFKDKTISNKYYFQVEFLPNADIPVEWITQLQSQAQQLYGPGQLPLGESVDVFVENFFKKAVGYKKNIAFRDLLDPRTYFTLDAGLSDENGKQISGSTGETYSAKVLLGIGRLSKVQSQNRPGIRFIILEETANLDKTNFDNFPAIAEEFGYQIITMTPKPFGSDSTAGWYLHHLLTGHQDPDINYPVPASYYKTNTAKEQLISYLKRRRE